MIRFQNVSLEYRPGNFALENLSFVLESGSFTFLTGHSGAGKSSLLQLIARLTRPSSGDIQIGNIVYSELGARQERALRQQMGIVFQDNQLLHDRNVFDNIALPLIIGKYRFEDIKLRVNAALAKVGLDGRGAEMPINLSGGEQQRVGIARAVVARPKVLLADEPTGNLDNVMSQDIMQLLTHFNASGVTVIFATHDESLIQTSPYPRLTLVNGQLDGLDNSSSRTSRIKQHTAANANQRRMVS